MKTVLKYLFVAMLATACGTQEATQTVPRSPKGTYVLNLVASVLAGSIVDTCQAFSVAVLKQKSSDPSDWVTVYANTADCVANINALHVLKLNVFPEDTYWNNEMRMSFFISQESYCTANCLDPENAVYSKRTIVYGSR